MAVEAQRLIAISLGKMASSRAQRGGVRLHKSLLVASVLHSAQTVALLNSDHQNLDLTFPSPSNRNVAHESCMLSDVAEFSTEGADDEHRSDRNSFVEPKRYFELSAPSAAELDADQEDLELVTLTSRANASPPSEDMTTFASIDDELRLLGNNFSGYVNSSDSCNELVDSYLQSHTRKRVRNYSIDEPSAKHLRFSLCNDYTSSGSIESMQTDPWQVTNLVYSFSIGFSGLLRNSEASEFSLLESTETDQPLYIHSSTSESIISCSTHIREALDTLTRSAIAMTV